jgi:hypothetical protein
MDTKQAAVKLGTTPKRLRQFLRHRTSTYTAVGSTSRYEFQDTDLPELERRFRRWADGKVMPTPKAEIMQAKATSREDRDRGVWAEEAAAGKRVVLDDLRNPSVRARVRAIAAAQEARLNQRLLAAGVHISQGFTSSIAATA